MHEKKKSQDSRFTGVKNKAKVLIAKYAAAGEIKNGKIRPSVCHPVPRSNLILTVFG